MSTDQKLIVACPSCDTRNAVPASRLGDHGKCGNCGKPLFQAHPMALTEARFQRHAAESDIPLAVDFWAEWCGPCKQIAPIVDELAKEFEGKISVAKVDIDHNPATPSKYNVRGIPTLMLFKGGQVAAMKVGAAPKGALADWIRTQL